MPCKGLHNLYNFLLEFSKQSQTIKNLAVSSSEELFKELLKKYDTSKQLQEFVIIPKDDMIRIVSEIMDVKELLQIIDPLIHKPFFEE